MELDIKLMVVFNKLSYQFMDKLSKDLESNGMPSSTYAMLAHLNQVGKSKTQKLGEVALITSGTITHVVNKMILNGYVIKTKAVDDKRISLVQITELGRLEFSRVNDIHIKYLNNLLSVFSEEEKQELIKQVKYFGKTLSKGRN